MRRVRLVIVFFVFIYMTGAGQSLWEIRVASFSGGPANDYAPAFFQHGILFTSDRLNDVFNQYRTTKGNRTSNLYFVEKRDSVHFGKPKKLIDGINTFVNEGPVSYDAKNQLLYFTRNLLLDKKNKKQPNNTGIFLADYNNGNWGNIRPFSYNNPAYNVGHPAISPDGKMLFFSSDMPGGYGGPDIYVCYRQGDSWAAPKNLGKVVNSPGADLFPFYHSTGRLYFASARQDTLPNLDIYYTVLVNEQWITPVRLRAPFNSPADDYAYIIDSTMHSGLFSSSRKGRDNIFMFTSLLPEMKGCRPVEEPVNCFLFYETQSKGNDTIPIIYKWDFGDGHTGLGHTVEHCYDNPGQYLARLSVADKITKEVRKDVAKYLVDVVKAQYPYIAAPDTCYTGAEIKLDGVKTNIPGFQPERYFWDFGNGKLAEGAEIKNIFYVPGIYRVHLLVRGLTTTGNRVNKCVYKKVTVLSGKKQ